MLGYKVFNSDWTCRRFQYEVGKTYRMEGIPICCKKGFHFCKEIIDCFDYYEFSSNNKFALVESRGAVQTDDDKKFVTNVLRILKEVSWAEVLKLVNVGDRSTGCGNIGEWNSGDWNTGYRNSGNRNTGYLNSGDWNTGNHNSGDFNTGNWNSGICNNGNWNSGNGNSGWFNTGNYNSGDFNSGNRNSGCFNSRNNNIFMFNKLTSWTMSDWVACRAKKILYCMPINIKERQEWYDALGVLLKEEITSLPNFSADIFKEITGISVNKE